MGRFKVVDYSARFLPVDLSRQLLPGTFEFALHHLLEHELDLSEIESRYCNDEVGASAYEPRILLKIVLLAYARGILSSRGMEAVCRDNVQFIALSGDAQPDQYTGCIREQVGRGGVRGVHAGAHDLRSARVDRARDVCDRRGQAGVQCEQSQERHAQRLRASGQ